MSKRIFLLFVVIMVVTSCNTDPGLRKSSNTIPPGANSNQNANIPANQNLLNATDASPIKTDKESHDHSAPHGGTLIAFGEEFAHLEIILDPSSGSVKAYALDGEAERSVRIVQDSIVVEINRPVKLAVKIEAVENSLTGDKRGSTSEFSGQDDGLKNVSEFDGRLKSISIRGRTFENVEFNYPGGNEKGH